jgi:hypothetical protein
MHWYHVRTRSLQVFICFFAFSAILRPLHFYWFIMSCCVFVFQISPEILAFSAHLFSFHGICCVFLVLLSFCWCVWVLNISNMNNILNLIANFKTMKMCLDVEYNSDSFWICVWVLNFWDWKKVFYNGKKWLKMIGLYERLCIMIGVMKISVNF